MQKLYISTNTAENKFGLVQFNEQFPVIFILFIFYYAAQNLTSCHWKVWDNGWRCVASWNIKSQILCVHVLKSLADKYQLECGAKS